MTFAFGTQLTFRPLGGDELPRAVYRRLRQAIVIGLLTDGSALPSESELASLLDVSTATLRAALAQLRLEGLLVTRRGRAGGSFVRAPSDRYPVSLHEALTEFKLEDLRDLRDYHSTLASSTAGLAARRARGQVLERLSGLGQAIGTARGVAARVRADSRFHVELAAATRCAGLARLEMEIQGEIGLLLWLSESDGPNPQHAAMEHRLIVDAVSRRDSAAARDLAESHIADGINRLIQVRMEMLDDSVA